MHIFKHTTAKISYIFYIQTPSFTLKSMKYPSALPASILSSPGAPDLSSCFQASWPFFPPPSEATVLDILTSLLAMFTFLTFLCFFSSFPLMSSVFVFPSYITLSAHCSPPPKTNYQVSFLVTFLRC